VVGRHSQDVWCLAFRPDGRRLASASLDGTVKIWRWEGTRLNLNQQPLCTLPVRPWGFGNRVTFTSDGERLVMGGEERTVQIWDLRTGQLRQSLSGHTGNVVAVAASRDGRWIASAGEDTTIRLWEATTGRPRHTLRGHTGLAMSLAFSPDSRRLVSGSRDHTVKVWDLTRLDGQRK
jgi:WD40 repeat protein